MVDRGVGDCKGWQGSAPHRLTEERSFPVADGTCGAALDRVGDRYSPPRRAPGGASAPHAGYSVEVVNICEGRAWRVALTARDREARVLVDELLPETGATATWRENESGWSLSIHREYAGDGDPLIEVSAALGDSAELCARIGGRTIRITPALHAAAPLRAATPRETVEVGLRWVLGWDHLGCCSPDERAFWAEQTAARAFVADDIPAWIANGPRVPVDGRGRQRIFVAYAGVAVGFRERLRLAGALEDQYPDLVVDVGMFVTSAPGTRALVAVAELR